MPGAITVTTNGDGVLSIGNTHNSGVTFSGAIGTNGNKIGNLIVESSTRGNATFNSTVDATAADIDTDGGSSTLIFAGDVRGGAWNIETGGSGDTAALNFRGDLTLTSLNIDKETAEATVTFDGGSAQTIAGNFTATADGDGTLVVNNSNGVTFSGTIGTSSGNKVGNLNVKSTATFSSTVDATAADIDTDAGSSTVIFTGNVVGGAWNIETGGSRRYRSCEVSWQSDSYFFKH